MTRSFVHALSLLGCLAFASISCGGGNASTQTTTTPAPESSGSTQTPSPPPPPAAEDAGAPVTDAATESSASADAGAVVAANLPPMPEGLHGPEHPWAGMSHQQKARYMADAVMPAMTALFHAYDSTRYAQVTCATCHGTNARQVNFRMPNRLPTLPAFGTPEAQHAMQENARMYQFMGQRVVPAMSQVLGVEPFNMQTHQGFGCGNCHPHQGT